MESRAWKSGSGKRFDLKKDTILFIPEDMKEIRVGLGWDTKCDIDASIILLDKQGRMVDYVFYGKKESKNRSIWHSGDNLDGSGDGDDETIFIRLDKITKNVCSIWPVITIYTSDNQFDDVSGAYCRLMDPKGNEFCRYNLS